MMYTPKLGENSLEIIAYKLYVMKKRSDEEVYLCLPNGKKIEIVGDTQEQIHQELKNVKR